jgi:hypothetical protein
MIEANNIKSFKWLRLIFYFLLSVAIWVVWIYPYFYPEAYSGIYNRSSIHAPSVRTLNSRLTVSTKKNGGYSGDYDYIAPIAIWSKWTPFDSRKTCSFNTGSSIGVQGQYPSGKLTKAIYKSDGRIPRFEQKVTSWRFISISRNPVAIYCQKS